MILQLFTLIQTKCSTFSSFNTETCNIDGSGAVSVNGTNDRDEGRRFESRKLEATSRVMNTPDPEVCVSRPMNMP